MSTISNTTVISNFACIGQLDLLRRLYGRLYISTEVYEEIQAGLEEGYAFYSELETQIFPNVKSGWIHLTSLKDEDEFHFFVEFPARLHKGEASSLAIAHHRGWLFLSDDLNVRKVAMQFDVRLSGSLGCLILAAELHLCSLEQANTWLTQMIREGYHSPVDDLTELL